jgi:hypothetical protein
MPQLGRILIVLLTMAGWLSISNHCVLGTLVALQQEASAATMHCHEDAPVPEKGGEEIAPCCKVLKAVVASKINVGAGQIYFVLKEYSTDGLTVAIWQPHTHTLELDTGPPKAVSFSELVLQRSILAHAPPSLS